MEAINGIANAKIDLGELYIEFGKYNKALNILEDSTIKSLQIHRDNNRDALHNEALGFLNIGKIFAIDGRAKKALEYFNLILARKDNNTLILNHRALVYDDISELYRDLEDRDKANEFYLKALYDYNTKNYGKI